MMIIINEMARTHMLLIIEPPSFLVAAFENSIVFFCSMLATVMTLIGKHPLGGSTGKILVGQLRNDVYRELHMLAASYLML